MNIKLKDEKNWLYKPFDNKTAEVLAKKLNLPLFVTRLLTIRGVETVEQAVDFLGAADFTFPNPFFLADMDKAVQRIERAIKDHERILIYGDYDVDGISSVSALYLHLRSRGANVCYYIPERLSEGYGMNKTAIEKFAAAHISLIITVDTGITADAETTFAKEHDMDVIITDHHECRDVLPKDAVAVINPKRPDNEYPYTELAGVGVVFKLICALEENRNLPEICKRYLDIVSLGTVADVMPMTGENRRIVVHGLGKMVSTEHVGIRSLIAEACSDVLEGSRKLTSSTIGFAIAPRLNAAGRIGDVKQAVELLITENEEKAKLIASSLCALNKERQTIENDILTEALSQMEGMDLHNNKVIVLSSDHWHQGVIGIVASRITEKYGLPSILVTFNEGVGKGSARSIPGFNINEALNACRDTLIKCGGHELAAGLSVSAERYDEFVETINDYARDRITDDMRLSSLTVDCEISTEELDEEHVAMLSMLEPYGNGNPTPVFSLRDVTIEAVTPIGSNKHLKLQISKNGKSYTAMYFNKTPEEFSFAPGETADVAFNLEINEFRGVRTLQLNIRDMKLGSEAVGYINAQGKAYLRAIASGIVPKSDLPDMPHFRAAFIYIRSLLKNGTHINIYRAARNISQSYSCTVTPCMMNLMLDIFCEMGLLEVERDGLNDADLAIINVDSKVNLEQSKLLTTLRKAAI